MLKEPLKLEDTVMSPEGLEEVIKSNIGVNIMLTQGGKYRVYMEMDDTRDSFPKCFDTLEDAKKHAQRLLLMTASMLVDSKKTMEVLFGKRE